MKNILILFAHPAIHKSRVNSKLLNSVMNLENVTVHQLYEEYPDFYINIKREQELLMANDIIVWHHPFYWYSAPAILKEWIDLVLEHGFAYGQKGTALRGKTIIQAITTGGKEEAYINKENNQYIVKQLLAPFRRTAELCRMFYLPPFVIHGTHTLDNRQIELATNHYQEVIISLRDELFPHQTMCEMNYLNEIVT